MKVIIISMQPISIQFAVRVRKDYTPLHVYLGCVRVVIYVKYITYEGLLHNNLTLDVDTVQEACVYSRVRKDYTPLHVIWAVILAAIVELNSDWLNRFTRTLGSGLGHPDWVIAKHSK